MKRLYQFVGFGFLTVCYYHVTYEFQSESTFYSLPECQGTPCSKHAPYLKFKWQQRDSNPKWVNGWVFVYELSGFGFESRCCQLFSKLNCSRLSIIRSYVTEYVNVEEPWLFYSSDIIKYSKIGIPNFVPVQLNAM